MVRILTSLTIYFIAQIIPLSVAGSMLNGCSDRENKVEPGKRSRFEDVLADDEKKLYKFNKVSAEIKTTFDFGIGYGSERRDTTVETRWFDRDGRCVKEEALRPTGFGSELITKFFFYDTSGRISEKCEKGETAAFIYDAVGRVKKVYVVTDSDRLLKATAFQYDDQNSIILLISNNFERHLVQIDSFYYYEEKAPKQRVTSRFSTDKQYGVKEYEFDSTG